MDLIIPAYVPDRCERFPAMRREYNKNPVRLPGDKCPDATREPPYPRTRSTAIFDYT
jgi:hypothetical protein